jgi:putative transposase
MHQASYPVTTLCRVLGVSPSGYYAWSTRRPSQRAHTDEVLSGRIRAIHQRSRGTYSAPRIHAELAEEGVRVGRKRVARLLRMMGLDGVSRRRGCTTTRRSPDARPAPDLVERNFAATGPDRLSVADITYIATWMGFVYLAVVMDARSRRIVGWALRNHLGTNALCESFFASLECELLDRESFRTQAEARHAVFEYIEDFYNPRRRHSALGYHSPMAYERRHHLIGLAESA